jgi:hypothetical protein
LVAASSATSPACPRHRLAILPGMTHVTVVDQVDLVVPMIKAFLGAPMPEAK